jgi:Methyltransferase domain
MKSHQNSVCRLCEMNTDFVFSLQVLSKYNISYYKCSFCKGLQTEEPFWLQEAYANNNLSKLDTGAAQRNIKNLGFCYAVVKTLNLKNVIDVGGGDGFLCRLLRDYGINCFVKDKYAFPSYAQGYQEEDFTIPDLVTAFEVLEHYQSPKNDISELFKFRPKAVLVSTEFFNNQRSDWWYLLPGSGQHVFFYSNKSLEYIANKFNYDFFISGRYALFVQKNNYSRLRILVARFLINKYINCIIRMLLVIIPTKGIWNDHINQR